MVSLKSALITAVWLVHLLKHVIEKLSDLFFGFVYRNGNEKLPPITNLILQDSATTLALKIRTKKLSSTEVVQSFIERIREVNPILNCAVDERFEDALKDARKVDDYLASTKKSVNDIAKDKPFLGVPFTTKDSVAVEGLSHTAGLCLYQNRKAEYDADVVALMKKAGAIPLAVTNVSELCMWWESSNNVYGRTNNAYHTGRIVGGSSGGEACLQSCAGAPFGIGSDIGGSIRMPAFFNGVFGHKASSGLISNKGQLPLATGELDSFLSTGPLCRSATDLIPMLKVLLDDNLDRVKLDEKVNLKQLKYYYMEDDGGSYLVSPVSKDIKLAMRKVIQHFSNVYGIKFEKVSIKKLKRSLEIWSTKLSSVEAPSYCEEMKGRQGSVNIWLEFLRYALWLSPHTLPSLMLALMEKLTLPKDSPERSRLTTMCTDLQRELQDLLGSDGVFLYPTHPRPAPYHNQPLLMPLNFSYTCIFNVLGLPATHCPLGLNEEGLPIGIQVIGAHDQDHLTLAVAAELEKAFGGWVAPCPVE